MSSLIGPQIGSKSINLPYYGTENSNLIFTPAVNWDFGIALSSQCFINERFGYHFIFLPNFPPSRFPGIHIILTSSSIFRNSWNSDQDGRTSNGSHFTRFWIDLWPRRTKQSNLSRNTPARPSSPPASHFWSPNHARLKKNSMTPKPSQVLK